MPLKIYASLMSADLGRLREEVQKLDEAGVDGYHIDIMDGHFVPNFTFGPDMVRMVRHATTKFIDVHLMITPAGPHLNAFLDAGADAISMHIESEHHIYRQLEEVITRGVRAGLSINPGTPLNSYIELLDYISYVNIMSVSPGFAGQRFISRVKAKVDTTRVIINNSHLVTEIVVDGGIDFFWADRLRKVADILISGTTIFNPTTGDYTTNIRRLRG